MRRLARAFRRSRIVRPCPADHPSRHRFRWRRPAPLMRSRLPRQNQSRRLCWQSSRRIPYHPLPHRRSLSTVRDLRCRPGRPHRRPYFRPHQTTCHHFPMSHPKNYSRFHSMRRRRPTRRERPLGTGAVRRADWEWSLASAFLQTRSDGVTSNGPRKGVLGTIVFAQTANGRRRRPTAKCRCG